MSAEPFPPHPPRAPDAELLTRSLKRPTLAVWMMGIGGVMMAWNAKLGYDMNAHGLAAVELVTALLLTYGAVRHALSRQRLRSVWRSGVRVDVVLTHSFYFWTRAYRYRVELEDGRWGTVILRAPSDAGKRLPALVDGDLIAVSDFGGCLKAGRLRRAPQTVARVV